MDKVKTLVKNIVNVNEDSNISIKLVWKLLIAVFFIVTIYMSMQLGMKDNTKSINKLEETQTYQFDIMTARLAEARAGQEDIRVSQQAMEETLTAHTKKLEEIVGQGMWLVEAGDTIWSIAIKIQMHPQTLIDLNPHIRNHSRLPVGQIIYYPKALQNNHNLDATEPAG